MKTTNADLTTETLHTLSQTFGRLAGTTLEPAHPLTLDDVRDFLIVRILELLDRNRAMLMSILYRVDVTERDVQRVFSEAHPNVIAPQLADLLIERQLQKLRLRKQYSSKKEEQDTSNANERRT